ncbi:hypothetical protein ABK040_007603 [Willaertia magna]
MNLLTSYSCTVHSLKIGSHVIINNCPCIIKERIVTKTGKHGRSKAFIKGADIFTGKKHEMIISSHDSIEVPIVSYQEYKLIDIFINTNNKEGENDDNIENNKCICLLLKTDEGELKNDIKLFLKESNEEEEDCKENIGMKLIELFEKDNIKVVTIKAMDKEHVISYKIY